MDALCTLHRVEVKGFCFRANVFISPDTAGII